MKDQSYIQQQGVLLQRQLYSIQKGFLHLNFIHLLLFYFFLVNSQTTQPKVANEQECNIILSDLKADSIFGELNFFTGMPRRASAKSKQFTTIMKIQRDLFLQIIKNREKDFEIFCQISDNLKLNNNYKDILLECKVCDNGYHLSNYCPLVHLDKSAAKAKISYQQRIIQNRSSFERKLYLKYQSRRQMIFMKQKAQELINLTDSVDDYDDNSNNIQTSCASPDSLRDYNLNKSITSIGQEPENQTSNRQENVSCKNRYSIFEDLEVPQSNGKISIQKSKSDEYFGTGIFEQKETKMPSQYTQEDINSIIKINNHTKNIDQLIQEKDEFRESSKKRFFDQQKSLKRSLLAVNNTSGRDQKQINRMPTKKYVKQLSQKQQSSLHEYMVIFDKLRQQILQGLKQDKNQQFNKDEDLDNQDQNPWEFEKLKDYLYFFPNGNSKILIQKFQNFQKKKLKSLTFKNKK